MNDSKDSPTVNNENPLENNVSEVTSMFIYLRIHSNNLLLTLLFIKSFSLLAEIYNGQIASKIKIEVLAESTLEDKDDRWKGANWSLFMHRQGCKCDSWLVFRVFARGEH